MSQKQCPAHQDELLDINCKTCRIMICYQCCLGAHQNCEKTLTKYNARKIKHNLAACLRALKVELEPIENRLSKLEEDKESTSTQIREMTEELSAFINNQAEKWLGELETAHLKESGALQERKNNIDKVITNIKENIVDMDSFLAGEDTEGVGKAEPKFQSTYDYQPKHDLGPLRTDLEEFNVEKVTFEINKKFVELKNKILQESMIESAPVPIEENQISHRETYLFSEKLFGINDMIVLPNNNILISEACYKSIWKFSPTGQYLQKARFSSEPFGFCILPDNRIAVSQPAVKTIIILDCDSLTENESFSFEKPYQGLAPDSSARIFALYRDTHIYVDIISKDNPQSGYEIIQCVRLPPSIYACDGYRLRVLPSSGNMVIINWTNSLNVVCISQSGAVVFRYEGAPDHRFSSISDIAVSENFIFVADKTDNKIHRIQHDGSFVDVPFTANDDISQPKKIFVGNGDKLAILSQMFESNKLQLFSV